MCIYVVSIKKSHFFKKGHLKKSLFLLISQRISFGKYTEATLYYNNKPLPL